MVPEIVPTGRPTKCLQNGVSMEAAGIEPAFGSYRAPDGRQESSATEASR